MLEARKGFFQPFNSISSKSTTSIDQFVGEEAKFVHHTSGQLQTSSPTQPLPRSFHNQIIPSTPRDFQPRISTVSSSVPHPSPNTSTTRPSVLASPFRPSPVPPSNTLQPISRISNPSRAKIFPLPPLYSQVFQRRDHWPVKSTR
ncbi:hypothetical protein O181_019893 [Austropuccinia psidii MF-1]|uniref:Uncharacterized protein n=1 Tax=Austropuccinia psidii MF-1 TaxID=1389203 RepID=A0A9Q3CBX4_9BASI|nr:hypothetical protein [Austropuccinia psidii MF-1]